jgi:hypothetical protein
MELKIVNDLSYIVGNDLCSGIRLGLVRKAGLRLTDAMVAARTRLMVALLVT